VPNLAVIGHPVAHSRSPAMQTAALTEMGLAGEWTYGALDVAPEDFEAEVAELAAAGEYVGVNVTVPHKEAALTMADVATEGARAIGAANTLSFKDGKIAAANTDAGGLLRALPRVLSGERALVLGAGGAARAAIWALSGDSARVEVWNRTSETAEKLAGHFQVGFAPTPDAADYDLIVNTTAVGLGGEDPFDHLPLAADSFRPGQVIVDMVYGDAPSPLLAAAEAAGAATVDGLEMLVQQGALSLLIWTGEEPSLEAMRAAVRD
jgi:shikimate dehydrogenase